MFIVVPSSNKKDKLKSIAYSQNPLFLAVSNFGPRANKYPIHLPSSNRESNIATGNPQCIDDSPTVSY